MAWNLARLKQLNDRELLARVVSLAGQSAAVTAELVWHLGEMDARKLYLGQGFSSLFAYCIGKLGLSEGEAYKRIQVARLSRRYPLVLSLIKAGRLHLTGACLLAPVLTEENHQAVLGQAQGKTKREIEVIVATLAPRPEVKPSVRRLKSTPALPAPQLIPGLSASAPHKPAPSPGLPAQPLQPVSVPGFPAEPVQPGPAPGPQTEPAAQPLPAPPASPLAAARVEPLAPARYRVTFTANATFVEKLRRAEELLSHKIAPGDLEAVFEQALDLLCEREQTRRFGVSRGKSNRQARGSQTSGSQPSKTSRQAPGSQTRVSQQDKSSRQDRRSQTSSSQQGKVSRQARGSQTSASLPGKGVARSGKRSRSISAQVRREVYERDGGQCSFVGEGSKRCEERRFLELHHLVPFAHGGVNTASNLTLRCRAHNGHAARQDFGPELLARRIAEHRSLSKRGP